LISGLGFLGYYVGGEVWIWISDTAATRLSGMPELGQMLSSVSEDIFTGPWKMFATGTLVFITVLGFNLLGEGLRRTASSGTQPSRWRDAFIRWQWRFEDEALPAIKHRLKQNPLMFSFASVAILAVLFVTVQQIAAFLRPQPITFPVPGGHLWGSQWHDPYATMFIEAETLEAPSVLWQFNDADGFSGGPAVAKDGTIYLATRGGKLISLSPDGASLWSRPLPAASVGSPALDTDGNIYVTDMLLRHDRGCARRVAGGQIALADHRIWAAHFFHPGAQPGWKPGLPPKYRCGYATRRGHQVRCASDNRTIYRRHERPVIFALRKSHDRF
jgi:hypothetical protein